MKNKRRLFLSLFIVVTFVIILLGLFIYFDYSNNAIFNRTIKSYSIDEFKSFDSIKVIEVDNEYIKSNDGDMIVLSAAENHFYFSGLPFIEKNDSLCRLDTSINWPDGIKRRNCMTSGATIQFETDSDYVYVEVNLGKTEKYEWFTEIGSSGIDVYQGDDHDRKWIGSGYADGVIFNKQIKNIFHKDEGLSKITIVLPTYAEVESIYIGLENSSVLRSVDLEEKDDPILFYGSSITQGCASSRPGITYSMKVGDYFERDIINFGFSSSAKGEIEVAEIIGSLDLSAIVIEYDHNAETVSDLRDTHYNFYKEIRESNSEVPIILMSRFSGDLSIPLDEAIARRDVVKETYEKAKIKGDKNIFFIDGLDILNKDNYDDYFSDDRHPNDLGMELIANEIIRILEGKIE